ncbi:hypothetical protein C370_07337 [Cryptococcus neoformans A1-35-8]|nr:hypothetical protein C370_07337 [Cryptococcus neoformans var. grubii A1-35-8]
MPPRRARRGRPQTTTTAAPDAGPSDAGPRDARPIASSAAPPNPLLNLQQSLVPSPDTHSGPIDPSGASLAADPADIVSIADSGTATELGHPANRDQPYPLNLVPFDIANPLQHEESLVIRPYDDIVCCYKLREYWVKQYEAGRIEEGVEYEDQFVFPYLRSFYHELEAIQGLKACRGECLEIFPTVFTTSVRLDLDIWFRPGDTVRNTLDGNGVEVKEARKRKGEEEVSWCVLASQHS